MEYSAIEIAAGHGIDRISESCGEVTVGCTDVAGIIESVMRSSERLRSEHSALHETVAALETDQLRVAQASDEARLLSERAIERLGEGSALIQSSLGQITELLELVETLTQHVTGFAAAMAQVRSSAQEIDQIAETTNILALNATIEAMRAGDAGRTFAVVANEVKSLASSTRRATEEIGRTIDTLGKEADEVITKIERGGKASGEAKLSVGQIQHTMRSVNELIVEVDGQNDQITRATATISNHVHAVQGVLESFDRAAIDNEQKLAGAHTRIEDLELTASGMFDELVKAGLSPQDSAMVDKAQTYATEIVALAEAAVAEGRLPSSALFDEDYREVPGSNPKRYRTALSDWADNHWRPVNDRVVAEGGPIKMCSQADMRGFLPTHVSDRSRQPTGDLAHDTKYCRNGRILFDPIDRKAKASNAPYMMAVYRQEGDGTTYEIVRNVYVPLVINGRRWGDFELAYVL
ncbi:Methyl-accepting chemotaxis protein PctB [Tsuneonella dongtanensis]|uniref:Methyl-accepting chemotaxis protein PctB n=1 Tax=Tsuneonella dongtanensis TaxID=692370 RepID=A0A1B2AEM3_9SPHN|nr:methyl-accepting chemotaxis protein [Tsuneonella dongtanensis]ANY20495.1 Methyl-accepting chemotaxis protein PctB [Tsuneonella dongtanensis]